MELGTKTDDVDYKTTAGEDILVLPSQKRTTKKKKTETVTKILSKKQRKRLEKIVETKKKKENVRNIKFNRYTVLKSILSEIITS